MRCARCRNTTHGAQRRRSTTAVKATLSRAADAAAATVGVIDHRDPCLVTLGTTVAIHSPSFSCFLCCPYVSSPSGSWRSFPPCLALPTTRADLDKCHLRANSSTDTQSRRIPSYSLLFFLSQFLSFSPFLLF